MDEIAAKCSAHASMATSSRFAAGTVVGDNVADQIRDLLRHEARGRAMDAFVAELREKANIEYR